MRLSVLITALAIMLMSAAGSKSADNSAQNTLNIFGNIFGLSSESCYNYTFIDNKSIQGTLLEKEKMDSSPGKPDSILYDTVEHLCRPNNARHMAALEDTNGETAVLDESDSSSTNPILFNPGVKFIDDGQLYFQQFQGKQTIFYGGLVPFVAVHDSSLDTNDHFLNPQSISLFLYFKRKF